MAYDPKGLSLLSYTGAGTSGNREYHYSDLNGDGATAIIAANYFDASIEQIYTGDLITIGPNGKRYIATNTGSHITLAAA